MTPQADSYLRTLLQDLGVLVDLRQCNVRTTRRVLGRRYRCTRDMHTGTTHWAEVRRRDLAAKRELVVWPGEPSSLPVALAKGKHRGAAMRAAR